MMNVTMSSAQWLALRQAAMSAQTQLFVTQVLNPKLPPDQLRKLANAEGELKIALEMTASANVKIH